MNKSKQSSEDKIHLEKILTDMIDTGSDHVTTLSKNPEAKYESIEEKNSR